MNEMSDGCEGGKKGKKKGKRLRTGEGACYNERMREASSTAVPNVNEARREGIDPV